MGTNKEETPESGSQANYEAAVLDFLDREMAAVQPKSQQDQSGQEVDALVTDLLKQVITESDRPNDRPKAASETSEDILAEFPPAEAEQTPPGSGNAESPDEASSPPISAIPESSDSATSHAEENGRNLGVEPRQQPQLEEPFNPRIPNFSLGMGPRRKAPMIAAASVCLLIAIGAAVYYLWGAPKNEADAAELQSAASVAVGSQNTFMLLPAASQKLNGTGLMSSSPAAKSSDSRQITPKPEREIPVASSSASGPAVPEQKAAASGPTRDDPSAAGLSTNPIPSSDSLPIIVKPLEAQTSSPLEMASNLDIDKSVPPPMPERIALSNSVLEKNPALISQARVPDAAGSRNLIPSVLISQVSPAYPQLAVSSRISGSVVLELHIDKEGKVVEATPVSGPSVFYNEAVKAAIQYRYRPATLDGTNVSSKSRVTMVFNLNR